MHRTGVVSKQELTFAQFRDELFESRLTNAIDAIFAQHRCDLLADFRIFCGAEKNPLHGQLRGDGRSSFGKTFWQPSLGRTVFRTRTETAFSDCSIYCRGSFIDSDFRPLRDRAKLARNSQIPFRLMLDRSGNYAIADDLIEQPASVMTAITHPPWHSRQANFQCGSNRIWKNNRSVKSILPPKQARRSKNRSS